MLHHPGDDGGVRPLHRLGDDGVRALPDLGGGGGGVLHHLEGGGVLHRSSQRAAVERPPLSTSACALGLDKTHSLQPHGRVDGGARG